MNFGLIFCSVNKYIQNGGGMLVLRMLHIYTKKEHIEQIKSEARVKMRTLSLRQEILVLIKKSVLVVIENGSGIRD